ncbi:long-chain fatty acid--CoA ligase, partial [Streptomyces sp. SID10244]|nr:long-chain fatty acid--CoA ligase [Streptomyces sp. SID10244]
DFAIWSAGAVPVPIYDSSSGPQIEWIMRDSGAVAIVLEDAGHRAIFDGIENLPGVKVFQIDGADGETGAIAALEAAGAD